HVPFAETKVVCRIFQDIADDESSMYRLKAAEAYAHIMIRSDARSVIKYLKIALELNKPAIYYALGIAYKEIDQLDEGKPYIRQAAKMGIKVAQEK
ncbi:11068_t:CDS:1, partial [Dentiscutata erythropus]